jgi:hypothetical protein
MWRGFKKNYSRQKWMVRNSVLAVRKVRLQFKTFGFLVLFVLLPGLPLKADVVILQDGKVITGNVLQQDNDGVLVKMDYGTFRYPKSWIKDVRKDTILPRNESGSKQRLPSWGKIISTLATNGWAHELQQIPATVIDNGVLKDVPYISFRCNSGGYEINVYGDLDKPAGIEIGAVNYLVKSDEAKTNCANFIASVLTTAGDKKIVKSLNLNQKALEKKEDVTFETTFPDEPDAYGGWWISVYDETALTNARASGPELLAITQPRIIPKPQPVVVTTQPIVITPEPTSRWSSDDLSYSRSINSSGGDDVYVRGYYRKNGTYVQSYTRSSPHSR